MFLSRPVRGSKHRKNGETVTIPQKALVPQVHSFADCANDESREPPVPEGGRLDSKDPEHASPAGDAAPGIGIWAEHRNLAHNREP